MRLKSTDLIFGIQAKKLRDFFRTKAVYDNFHPDFFKDEMNLSDKEAKNIIQKMTEEQIVVKDDKDEYLNLLTKAQAIKNAKFVKPILRNKADLLVKELLDRVNKLNLDDYFVCTVEEVYVFGSYNSDSIDCADVDLVVVLKNKPHLTKDEIEKISFRRRPNGNFLERFTYATHEEPLRFLKNKNKYLSFHPKEDAENVAKLKLIWKKI